MSIVKKLIKSMKRDGIIITVKKIIYKIAMLVSRKIAKKKEVKIKDKIDFNKFKRVIVFENQFGWERIMKQRPQQIATAADEETLFIYGTTHMEIGKIAGIKKIKDNLYLMDLVIHKEELIEALKDVKQKYLMIYSTDYIPMDVLNPYLESDFKLIYEYVDGIDEKLCGKETAELLIKRHKKIINQYNPYIVTTATKLYDNIIKEKKDANVKLITNGVDYEHFANNDAKFPEEMVKLKKDNNIIIGYYGALASWFNYSLIKELAEKSEKYQIVLLGLDYDKTLRKSGILEMKNVHYFGKKSYEELPKYLHSFDICILPFIINEITLSTSPVKVFEYMAARKPIVTSDLPECRKYKSILIGKSDKDFIRKIELAESRLSDTRYLNLLTREAKQNDWKNKFNSLIELLSSGEENER